MRIRFTHDAIYETEGPGKGPRFAAGEVHDFTVNFANRWLRRGLAVLAEDVEASGTLVAEVELPPGALIGATDTAIGTQEAAPQLPRYHLRHAGGGRWHVLDAAGEKVTEAPLSKDEAQARLDELLAA
jgi:hypothetical protein